jgi:hypothetical protein
MGAFDHLSALKSELDYTLTLLTCSRAILVENLFVNDLSNGMKLQQQTEIFAGPNYVQ